MKKILILYAAYGGGHLSAAKSIKNYIDENYTDVETNMVDCIKYINKLVDKLTTGAYKQMAKKAPGLWKKVYFNSEKGLLGKFSSGTNKLMAKKLLHLLEAEKPDIIISTHPFATQMTSYLKKQGKYNCILSTVMTDFAPHEQWLVGNEFCEHFFVSHDKMKESLINDFNIPSEKVFATGIPLSPKFSMDFNNEEIYNFFDLNPNKKTILFFGGGEYGLGKKRTVEIFKALTAHLNDYQIIAVSGKNPKMNKSFNEIYSQIGNPEGLKIFDFIDKVPEAMHISDLVITKPGGLTTTESLASNLPILVINPIPGQEEQNAEFLEEAGVALWLRKKDDPAIIINDLLSNQEKLELMKENTKKLAHTFSTKNICDKILN